MYRNGSWGLFHESPGPTRPSSSSAADADISDTGGLERGALQGVAPVDEELEARQPGRVELGVGRVGGLQDRHANGQRCIEVVRLEAEAREWSSSK